TREDLNSKDNGYKKKTIVIDEIISSKINELVKSNKITLSNLLQAAWAILLHKYSHKDDIVFGVTVSGRPTELLDSNNMVGLFINTLPVRAKIKKNVKTIDWVIDFNHSSAELKDFEHSSLVDIKKNTEIPPKENLFDSLFVFENYPVESSIKSNNLSIEFSDFKSFERTNYPLTIVSAPGDKINIDAAFDSSIIEEYRIDLLLDHFSNILNSIANSPSLKINEIDLLTKNEKEFLLPIKFSDPKLPEPWVVIKKFEEIVATYPNNAAIHFGNSELSYKELNIRANKFAHFLIEQGVGIEDLVSICLNKNPEMIVSILGILKTGAGYVPIDPSYPKDRIQYILNDSSSKFLITEKQFNNSFEFPKSKTIVIDSEENSYDQFKNSNLNVDIFPENIIYLIYTSGSTGEPKGTVLQNKSVLNFIKDFSESIEVTSKSRILQFASIGFDASIPEIFSPLLNGGSVQLGSSNILDDLSKFNQFIIENKITELLLPPSVLSIIPVFQSPHLRTVLSAGEKCTWQIVNKWSKYYRFINGYGPTEASVGCTWGRYSTFMKTNSVPIGIPIFNVKVYVLDDNLLPVPFGVRGELFIGEDALARGYLNKPELTASKFLPNLYSNTPGERIYKTNDLVEVLSDGQLEFIGRKDNQVKLRGFRIELEEIEAILNNSDYVKESAVILKQQKDERLIAFIVINDNFTVEISEIIKQITKKLPQFMIPSHFEIIDSMPLTSRGKIDRNKLSKFEIIENNKYDAENTLKTTTEELLCSIVDSILSINTSSCSNNFFELGGHSLTATQLTSRIREAFNVDVPISKIFDTKSIGDLAAYIDEVKREEEYSYSEKITKHVGGTQLLLSFAQKRMWFIQKFDANNTSNNIFNAFTIKGKLNIESLEYAFNQIIKRHSILRTRYDEIDGQPFQVIEDGLKCNLKIIDLSENNSNVIEERLLEISNSLSTIVFNLTKIPLFIINLVKINEDEFKLFLSLHHIISDGWSISIIIKELIGYYREHSERLEFKNPDLEIQYSDFAQWQNRWLSGENLRVQLDYWKKELNNIPPIIDLPIDSTRPAVQTFNGNSIDFDFDESLTKDLDILAKKMNVTHFMLTLAAFKILLHKYSHQKTIVIGTPIANRNRNDIENLIGFFINTLVVRTDIDDQQYTTDFIKQVRERTLKAYLHQDIPFEKLVDHLVEERDLSVSPLFQVAFVYQNNSITKLKLPGITFEPVTFKSNTSKYDITLYLQLRNDKLFGSFEYNTDLFNKDTIERMISHFKHVIAELINKPKLKLKNLSLLSKTEYLHIVDELNSNDTIKIDDENVPNCFHKIVARHPLDIALTFSEIEADTLFTEQLTYDDLNKKSNQFARNLIKRGVKREELIGVSLNRSFDLI
ncbi:MAG: amino acid adenylation domain-containing protein, partial [Ignavibacteriales bacterium]|nr:amino acid adenylation domain-containing protein [Ignavibacteriales bacterium]